MTKKEAILVSAYTGDLLTRDFSDVQKFCTETLGRPIFTHELADEAIFNELREKLKPRIIELIESEVDENAVN